MYDLIIIGGGPGGVAAGIYAARKKLKAAVVADNFTGQSFNAIEIHNWIGTKKISGYELSKSLEEHLRAQEGIEIIEDRVSSVKKKDNIFVVETAAGKVLETKTVLVVSGSHRKRMDVPGEKELIGRGVAFCSTCDAPLYGGKTVAVVGAGNAGLEAVLDLATYADKIYLLARSEMKGDKVTQDKVLAEPKVQVLNNVSIQEVLGKEFVTGLKYLDTGDNQVKELKVDGIFVEIGALPNSDIVKDLVALSPRGEIIVDRDQKASLLGIWAAGDVSDVKFKQNNISAGDAIKAVLDIDVYLNKK
jgi:alkyl hydroperoxide reductase subunit F